MLSWLRRKQVACEERGDGLFWCPDATDVFCPGRNAAQQPPLLETDYFYVIPDMYPVTPGHLLIVAKHHYPCIGAMPVESQQQLQEIIATLRGFLTAAYQPQILLWENGGAWQSVHHAHLHLIPVPSSFILPPPTEARLVDSMKVIHTAVASGPYLYVELGRDKRLVRLGMPDWRQLTHYKIAALGADGPGADRRRDQHLASVGEARRRWLVWRQRQIEDPSLAA